MLDVNFRMPVAEILRPLPIDLPPAQLYAFLYEGRLGLWDGGAWLESDTHAATPFHLGSDVFHVAAPDSHVEELRTPSSIQEAWIEGPSAGLWQGPQPVGEFVPVLNSRSHPEVRTARRGTTMVGITHSATHSRALRWNLADAIPADVQPPQGYVFTGEHTVVEFACGFSTSDVVSADLMGIRSFAGVWSTLYRLRLGDRVMPLTTSDGQRLSTFTLGLGVLVKDLPFSFELNKHGLWEWSHTYVLSVGYVSTVACTTFRLDPRSAEGTISTFTWESIEVEGARRRGGRRADAAGAYAQPYTQTRAPEFWESWQGWLINGRGLLMAGLSCRPRSSESSPGSTPARLWTRGTNRGLNPDFVPSGTETPAAILWFVPGGTTADATVILQKDGPGRDQRSPDSRDLRSHQAEGESLPSQISSHPGRRPPPQFSGSSQVGRRRTLPSYFSQKKGVLFCWFVPLAKRRSRPGPTFPGQLRFTVSSNREGESLPNQILARNLSPKITLDIAIL